MCGIAGFVRLDNQNLQTSEAGQALKRMSHQLRFRGPDDEQIYMSGPVGFAFRRLSIVDLAGGQQPIFNDDKSIVLMANGEIYNHKEVRKNLKENHNFKSNSDCEVALHAYAELDLDFLKTLNGMFGIALYDKRKQRIILARDPLGIKPLYYGTFNNQLIFSSELKGIFAHPDAKCEVEWKQIIEAKADHWETYPDQKPKSYFKNIEYLEAGTALIVDLRSGQQRVHRYWGLDFPAKYETDLPPKSEEDFIEEYRFLLKDAVKMQLLGDVELGIFLSGGIDSVAIAKFAKEHQDFHSFTVMCESTYYSGDSRGAFEAAQYLNVPNHQLMMSSNSDISPQYWKDLLWATELHLMDCEQLYKFNLHRLAKQIRPKMKIILGGQGSDEFNGGYCHRWIKRFGVNQKNWDGFLTAAEIAERKSLFSRGGWRVPGFTPNIIDKVIKKDFLASFNHQQTMDPWDFYFKLHLHNLQAYNLWHEDRTAAANEIENRVPFLDHRIVEHLHKVPKRLRANLFWDKAITRRAMTGLLPKNFIEKPKIPFFSGAHARHTDRMTLNIMSRDDFALAEEAFGHQHAIFDLDALKMAHAEIYRDPEHKGAENLMGLVNLGLLEKIFSELHTTPNFGDAKYTLDFKSFGNDKSQVYDNNEFERYFSEKVKKAS